MPELGPYGSVRGALSNGRPYRNSGAPAKSRTSEISICPAKEFGADHGQNFSRANEAPRHQEAQPENAPAAISEQWGACPREILDPTWCRIRAGSRRPHCVFVLENCIRRDPIKRGDVPGAVELMPNSSDTVVRFHPAVPANVSVFAAKASRNPYV